MVSGGRIFRFYWWRLWEETGSGMGGLFYLAMRLSRYLSAKQRLVLIWLRDQIFPREICLIILNMVEFDVGGALFPMSPPISAESMARYKMQHCWNLNSFPDYSFHPDYSLQNLLLQSKHAIVPLCQCSHCTPPEGIRITCGGCPCCRLSCGWTLNSRLRYQPMSPPPLNSRQIVGWRP